MLLQAINNGINPQNDMRGGLQTGYLYDMETFEQVQDAFKAQLEYFIDWQFTFYTSVSMWASGRCRCPWLRPPWTGAWRAGAT